MHGFSHGWHEFTETWHNITETWPHGGEFAHASREEVREKIQRGLEILSDFTIRKFIAPFNAYTQELLDVLNEFGFEMIMGGRQTLQFGMNRLDHGALLLDICVPPFNNDSDKIIPYLDQAIREQKTILLHWIYEPPANVFYWDQIAETVQQAALCHNTLVNGSTREHNVDRPIHTMGDTTEAQELKARMLNRQGENLFIKGDIKGALNAFTNAIEIDPSFASAHNNLGVLYWQIGEIQKALKHIAKTLEIDPNDRDVILNCGEIFKSLGRFEDAKNIYSSYLQKNQEDEEIARALAELDSKINKAKSEKYSVSTIVSLYNSERNPKVSIATNRKIRVVHHLNGLGIGGMQKTVELFCKYTNKEVFDTFVIVKSPVSSDRAGNFQKILGENRLIFYNNDFALLSSILDDIKCDIIHVHRGGWPEPPINNFEKIGEIPVIIETNVFGHKDNTSDFLRVNRSLYVSDWLRRIIAKRSDRKSAVLFNPIELPSTESDLRTQLKIDQDCFVIGRIGRPDDAIYDPISLLAYAQMENHRTLFLVVAAPPRMKADALRLGIRNILFIEPTVDSVEISRFYNTIDVLAHARRDGETFGCVIAEAFIHSKPVISHYSHIMNAQSEIIEHGINGFMASVDAPAEYANYLNLLEQDRTRAEKMGEKAKDKVLQQYEASIITRRLERIYLEELENRRNGEWGKKMNRDFSEG
ncbi:MAG: tetratricopeptide repeat protein [Deltaproteobacteria bacterium]|nr:tetratricopeptide repeat protein [Deltaproteobacteria bacterium]